MTRGRTLAATAAAALAVSGTVAAVVAQIGATNLYATLDGQVAKFAKSSPNIAAAFGTVKQIDQAQDAQIAALEARVAALEKASAPAPTPPTTTTTTTPAPSSATVFVSTSGSDSAACTQASPCRSFGRAYQVAACGAVIEIAGGVYGGQGLTERAALNGCATRTLFRPAAGATVTIQGGSTQKDGLDFGTSPNGVQNVEVRGIRVNGTVAFYHSDSRNVVLDGVDGGSFYIDGADDITVRNGDWGPCQNTGGSGCSVGLGGAQNRIRDDFDLTSNILIEGNTIHDFVMVSQDPHFECLWTTGGTNVTIRGNRFYNCQTYAIALGPAAYDGRQSRYVNWLIENNWFGKTCCYSVAAQDTRNSAIMVGGANGALYDADPGVTIRGNSFAAGQTVVREYTTGVAKGVYVTGNILGNADSITCVGGVVYDSNVFLATGNGQGCGTRKQIVQSLPYVNADPLAGMNYHLSGPSAADGLVLSGFPATDFDGQPRSAPADAGADDR